MKKVLINVEERELRVAILEDEQLVELYIESLDERSILNNIYKGRVEDVLPGLKAAFVNVGLEKNAFLHFDDVRPDLLWAKYRELNPDMADEVPTAREALAAAIAESDSEVEETDDRRKRRRGRRGGKKRRPEAEDTYSPGLPVGVTEDDLEDDDEEEVEIAAMAAAPLSEVIPQVEPESAEEEAEAEEPAAQVAAEHDGQGRTPDEIEARRLARMEKQRQRRERWEQKKLERQQRRQQAREERMRQQTEAPPAPEVVEPQELEPVAAAPVYGTRAAASVYDAYSSFGQQNASQQRRALKQAQQRYGDNFGNIALKPQRRTDHRDSQVDFFGPASPNQEEDLSIWDEQQPDLGPVPGLGKAFIEGMKRPQRAQRRDRRPGGQQQQQGNQQQGQNRGNKHGGKRRGGKKRSMRKRDNRSFFALSADDILEDQQPTVEAAAEVTPAPKKTTRKRKTAAEAAEGAEAKPKTTRKPAAKKTTATKTTTRKKKSDEAPEAVAQELPLDIEATAEPAAEKKAPAKKTTRTAKKTTTTRTRKAAAKPAEPAEEPAKIHHADELGAAGEAPVPADTPVADTPVADTPVADTPVEAPPAPAEPTPAPESAPATAEACPAEAPPAEAAPKAEPQEEPAKLHHADELGAAGEQPVAEETPSVETSAALQAESAQEAAPAAEPNGRERRDRRSRTRGGRNRRGREAAAEQQPSTETPSSEASATETAVVPAEAPAPAPAPAQPQPQQQQRSQQPQRQDRRRLRRPLFQEVFKKGDEIMVQVVKEEIGQKGARISSYVSLPGRYLVLLPYPNQEGGISRKVEDIRERKRLKSLLRDISSDETAFIIRTAGIFQEEKEIRKDVEFLSQEWATIADRYKNANASALVYDDHDILYRLARDVFDDSVGEIYIDSHIEHDKLKNILSKLIPSLQDKVKLYSGAENIFHKFGVTKQIQKAARRKVWLKSGGYLIIDEAEALTAIDVNTGKSVGKDDQEKLILRTNLEAARAVARELKLRDIGGLIVIDFIDMKDTRNREQVLQELKVQLRKDRSKTSVSAISEFGLVEMTRKRVRRSLRKTLFMDCPYCQGAGAVLNEQQIWLHIKHEIVRQLESIKPAPSLSITVNPRIRAYIDQNYRDVIRRLEQKYDTEIKISMSDIFHIENYQIEKSETTGVISGSATMPTR